MELPTKILAQIMGYLSSRVDLAKCARVNRAIGRCALAILYRDIDLNRVDTSHREDSEDTDDERDFEDEDSSGDDSSGNEEGERRSRVRHRSLIRQRILLHTIAKRPHIGELVHSFENANHSYLGGGMADATENSDEDEILVAAAENMKNLQRAKFNDNRLASTILESIDSYPSLQELHVQDLNPIKFARSKAMLPLSRLTWEIPLKTWGESPWDSVTSILNFAMTACPKLSSLDISFQRRYVDDGLDQMNIRSSRLTDSALSGPGLRYLQHFGFVAQLHEKYGNPSHVDIESNALDFISRHKQTLTSWTTSIDDVGVQPRLQDVLRTCASLPNLPALDLRTRDPNSMRGPGTTSSNNYLKELSYAIAESNPLLEHFSLSTIGVPFDALTGKLFAIWQHIRVLRIGDGDIGIRDFGYEKDGLLDFEAYQKPILQFIQALPSTLEELYLKINATGYCMLETQHFDPMCAIGSDIFHSLRRLHTCDITAELNSSEGYPGPYPMEAVHWRRLRHVPQPGETKLPVDKIRDVWQSRMDCYFDYEAPIYEFEPVVSHEKLVVRLGTEEGVFEGEDAREVWLGGGDPHDRTEDRSWPWFGDRVFPYYGGGPVNF